ncbi:MAG: hypothetical protein K2K21_13615 [Lachnospiraceae bacterium]|nr:hypothetical protein [Lachnospiraceae bacterium]
MSRIVELVKYQLRIYFKGSRFIMPFIVVFIFMYMMYKGIGKVEIVDFFCITCYLVFLVMVWTGFSVASAENEVMEQIQMLRVNSNSVYYMGKELFLIVIGLLINCICLAFPVIKYVLSIMSRTVIFDRQLMGSDILNAFILLAGCSIVGGALGSFLHPNVMRDRKSAMLITLLAAVLTIIKTSIVSEIPVLKFITWILPPVDKIFITYGKEDYFGLVKTCGIFMLLVVYGVVYSLMKSVICCKRKYS